MNMNAIEPNDNNSFHTSMLALRRIRIWSTVLLMFVTLLAGIGCGCDEPTDVERIASVLKVGMTKSEVLELAGEPDSRNTVGSLEFWEYHERTNPPLMLFVRFSEEGKVTHLDRPPL
ncbi:MAG: outer membrane protein assembly factor BamE [Armatimonadetes bacterium]|nr:outer membrane protein assembly factor BamE [Armatimonadota bacterium]